MKLLLVEEEKEPFSLQNYFLSPYHHTLDSSQDLSYQLSRVHSFEDAFEHYNQSYPDIIVIKLDYEHTIDAIEFTNLIRHTDGNRHTGVVVVQGADVLDKLAAARLLESGVDDYIERNAGPREVCARVNSVFRFKLVNDELRTANHKLLIQSLTDDLTGLHNMRSFTAEYETLYKNCVAGLHGFSIVMIDLDHFKSVNDCNNHLVGSYVISQVGQIISKACSQVSGVIPARYGGDEYIIAMPTDNPQEVMVLGEAVRAGVSRSPFTYDDASVAITASIGFSWIPSGYVGDSETPIKAADMMLYRSKELGRDQVRGMMLRNAVDFDHVSRGHLIDRNASSDYDHIPRLSNIKFF